MTIRRYQPQDIQEITQLFYETIHLINVNDFSQEQLDVWAPKNIDLDT